MFPLEKNACQFNTMEVSNYKYYTFMKQKYAILCITTKDITYISILSCNPKNYKMDFKYSKSSIIQSYRIFKAIFVKISKRNENNLLITD